MYLLFTFITFLLMCTFMFIKQHVLEGLKSCSQKVDTVDRKISPLETVTTDVNKLTNVMEQIHVSSFSMC